MAYAARDPDCPFIISWRGKRVGDLETAWTRARERAGLSWVLVHDLRRTAVRNMIRAGIPEKRAMLISGHKTRSVFDRYDITDERDLQGDGERLARYLEERATLAEERQKLEAEKAEFQKVRTKVRTAGSDSEKVEPSNPARIQ
jgi:predicted subunit of tRNA(5-methylaminomethyl-2-thiouridylate) methyltransferase